MNYFSDNLKALLALHPNIGDKLSVEPDAALVIEPTQTGLPTALYKGVYIHSRHNPAKEASGLMAREVKVETSACVFYGFGLGYHVEAFIEAHPGIPLLVIEPDIPFFIKALESRDLKRIFERKEVRFFFETDPEQIIGILELMPLSHIQVIRIRSVFAKNEEFYTRIDGTIQSYLAKKEVNLNTLRRFGKRWVTNLTQNLGLLIEAPGIASIAGSLRGMPGIVLASGPSLETILPILCELHQKCVIISVDTSLNTCLKAGVDPDFLVIVDPQYWNTRHIDWAKPSTSILVSESSTHPRVFHMLDLPVIFSSSFFPLGQFFESIAGEKGKIGAGGSVATAAWDIARILGLDPIYMGGLDLGYPYRKTHFKGAFFEQTFHTISRKLKPSETFELAYLLEAEPFPTPSNIDTLTLTDKRMCIYKWWFETQMQIFKDTKTYNLSPLGVRVNGMELRKIEELLALPAIRPVINKRMAYIRKIACEHNASELAAKTANMKHALDSLLPELQRLCVLAHEGLREVTLARKRIRAGKFQQESLARLNAIDEKIQGESSRVIAGFLLQPIIQGILHSAKSDSAESALDTTERLYRELAESAEFHYEVLGRALR